MSASESDQMVDKITEGVKLAIRRLIERTKKEDGYLVFSKDGANYRTRLDDDPVNSTPLK